MYLFTAMAARFIMEHTHAMTQIMDTKWHSHTFSTYGLAPLIIPARQNNLYGVQYFLSILKYIQPLPVRFKLI